MTLFPFTPPQAELPLSVPNLKTYLCFKVTPLFLCFHDAWGLLGFVLVCTSAKESSSKPFYQKEGVRDDVSLEPA